MNVVLKTRKIRNPFPGLRPFQEGEEHLFFGREKQTDALVDKLDSTRFLCVIGSSGSGKSSLVNCGLRIALRSGLMPDAGTSWRMAQCRPGGSPIASLAKALAEPGVLFDNFKSQSLALEDILETNLRMSRLGIVDVFEQAHFNKHVNLLVVIDQFEELFRYAAATSNHEEQSSPAQEEATAFINLLLAVKQQTNYPIYIVLTMRSDFLGDCTRYEGLTEAINEGQYLVPRMTREERRMAVSGPIGVSGARIDPLLLTRLINDLGDNPDQLSILQHALNRIWALWEKQNTPQAIIGLEQYNAIGSMSQALDQHAEQAFEELDATREQLICERLFKALTNKATDARGVRRPSRFSMLLQMIGASEEELTRVIDTFRKPSRSFLMPPIQEKLHEESVVDISHESLMRMWGRLDQWADEEAESTRIYLRLSETAALHGDGLAGLWRDPDLQLALEWRLHNNPNKIWASRIDPGFDQAMEFLDDSRAASDVEKANELKVAQQERELEQTRAIAEEQNQRLTAQSLAARRLRFIVGGGIAMLLFLFIAFDQYREAEAQTELAETKTRAERETQGIARVLFFDLTKKSARLEAEIKELKTGVAPEYASVEEMIVEKADARVQVHNELEGPLILFVLNAELVQEQLKPLIPGGTTTLDGHVDSVWIARSIDDGGKIIHFGIMSGMEDTFTFQTNKS